MRSLGIDVGKVSFKAAILESGQTKEIFWKTHGGEIEKTWQKLKEEWQIKEKDSVVFTGKFKEMFPFPSIPVKVAQEKAFCAFYPWKEANLISLGGGGFSVLKIKQNKRSEWWLNPRCAAGTGAFLDQILARLGMTILQIDELVAGAKGLEITSRCGVTMKTDVTHLLNQGNPEKEVVAGLLDSLAKNAVALMSKSPLNGEVLLIGGLSVCQRIIQTISQNLNGAKIEIPEQALFFEALGAALIAGEEKLPKIKIAERASNLVFLPGLKNYLSQITKITPLEHQRKPTLKNLTLGLDIGSTGSKLVLLDDYPFYEAYCETQGNPVQAAKNLVQKIPEKYLNKIKAVGCTGSGREIVGPLLRASLPEKNHSQIFVLNEIAAHAQGAVYYDSKVDTVVDIGGQDSKFIRLEQGRVVDNAMNTVCSAGTGSFLAEQLQLLGIGNVKEFGRIALESSRAADLGQHCAIFVSEQIDEAQRKGAELKEIVAGLFYSIVRNYNNRVKGLRDYGQKIFLQGKPAENLALACGLAKVSGQSIVVPPSPGSIGALGIALLTKNEVGDLEEKPILSFEKFLKAEIAAKKQFKCQSKEGCGTGSQCVIDEIEVKVDGQKIKFFWNGRCDKYEKTGKKNLALARAPQPFLEREKIIADLVKKNPSAKKTIGVPRGLETEEILPMVIVFFQKLGFNVKLLRQSSLKSVEEGAKLCQASFCAPVQLLAGEAKILEKEDYLFLPKVIEILGKKEQNRCYVCPLSQAVPDMFESRLSANVLRPFLNFKDSYQKNTREFLKLGIQLGCSPWKAWRAFKEALKIQEEFEERLRQIGKEVLEFGRKNQIPVIVILGHPYIINSPLFNAGVPETIFEKGGISLPADCYPLQGNAPNLNNVYWGYGHRLLDAAYETRRQSGVFPIWLSVYSCGPDSFLIHFFQYLSQGKPYCLLESDAYVGQAGFKTRIEAFLYSIKNYRPKEESILPDLVKFEAKGEFLGQSERRKVLVPWMGDGSRVVPPLLKSCLNVEAECLPMADEEALELGRQSTSGRECLPMIVTFGSLHKYLKNNPEGKFSYFMPSAGGPCRFGQYQLLAKIILEKLGQAERVNIISPTSETGYRLSDQLNQAMVAKSWVSFVFADLLKDALCEMRPMEKMPGISEKIFEDYFRVAEKLILKSPNDWSGYKNLWGMTGIAGLAAKEFKRIPQIADKKPGVLVTGEIYVLSDEFSNRKIVRELEALGVKVKLAPFREWINYVTFQRRKQLTTIKQKRLKVYINWFVQKRIESRLYQIFAKEMGWPKDHSIDQILATAKPYLSHLRPLGEAALTIGLSLLLWKKKEIDGVILVGPFECMPTRIAETQLGLISEKTGLPILSLSFHGDPLDKELLESFIWDLRKN